MTIRPSDNEKLNIAMLCVHSHPLGRLGTTDTGGMSVYICETARELGRRGHRVDIFTRFNGSFSEKIMDLDENVRLIQVRAGEKTPITRDALYPHLDEFIRGMEAFRKDTGLRYDVVHSHYWLSGLVGCWAQRQWSAPLVMMFHTTGAAENTFSPRPEETEFRLIWERELVENCDLIVSPSEREAEEIIRYYGGEPSRISMIQCGVDLGIFYPVGRERARKTLGLSGREKVLIYVGRIDAMKGVDRLLSAVALLKARVNIKLYIVGGDDSPGPEQKRLRDMVRTLGLEDSVIFTGSLPQKELPLYYSAADVMVLPSHYESFGMAGLESLACGTPVIAANVGIYPQILNGGPAGRLVADGRAESFAEKIVEILAESGNNRIRPEDIREKVKQYTWSATAGALLDEYKHLVGAFRPNLFRKKVNGNDLCLCPDNMPSSG